MGRGEEGGGATRKASLGGGGGAGLGEGGVRSGLSHPVGGAGGGGSLQWRGRGDVFHLRSDQSAKCFSSGAHFSIVVSCLLFLGVAIKIYFQG